MAHMTLLHTACTHTCWGWQPVRGNCSPAVLSKSKMEGETDPAGKGRDSCAFANNAGLWVPGLILLAVRMRTTGPGLALGVAEVKKKLTMN